MWPSGASARSGSESIQKIDAHHHLYALGSPHHPFLTAPSVERFYGNTGRLERDFGPERFIRLAQAHNVVKSVYVESGFVPAIKETAYIQAIADEHGFPHAIIGKVDMESESVAADLDVHMRSRNFRGVRLSLNWDRDPLRTTSARAGLSREARWRSGYAELDKRGLSADIMILPAQFGDVAALAEDFPQTQIILNHAGLPFEEGAGRFDTWRAGMARLSGHPNIAVKISGLGMADHAWTVASIRPLVEFVVGSFGCDRCMFGSNFPIDALYSSYANLYSAFETLTRALSGVERRKLFHDTAMRIYRL